MQSKTKLKNAAIAEGSAALPCIDPALSAQLMLLRRMPRQGFACSAPDEGAGGYKNRSNPR